MASAQSNPNALRSPAGDATLARTLAPEEIRPGDYVAVLHEVIECPSWFWCSDAALESRDELVRVLYTPRDEPEPLKVRAVCLPFVLVRNPRRRDRTLDVRRYRLARLDAAYGRTARRAYRSRVKPGKRSRRV